MNEITTYIIWSIVSGLCFLCFLECIHKKDIIKLKLHKIKTEILLMKRNNKSIKRVISDLFLKYH